jgi:DNA-binding transcriptional ArsR family regulator
MSEERKKDLDEILEDALKNAPSIEGYTIRSLADVIRNPWPTSRWHLEKLEAHGIVEPYELGRAKIVRMKRSTRLGND